VTSREAYMLLNLLPGIGAIRVKQMLEHVGRPEEILGAKRTTFSRFPGIGPKLADVIVNWRQHADLD